LTNRSVWAIGDSHTAGVGSAGGGVTCDPAVYPSNLQGGLWYQGGSWVPWALMASGARWTIRGVAATGGYTAAQVLATHVPQIIAAATRGDTVVVHAGTNGNVLADVITIHAQLKAAGLNTVAVTIPPNTAGTLASTASFNEGLKQYALANMLPLVDLHALMVDPTTGLWLSSYNNDGTHSNQLGMQTQGAAIAAVLNTNFPEVQSLVNHNAVLTNSLQTKPLALGTPTAGVDYATLASIGTGTIAAGAVTGFGGGNAYVFTYGDTFIQARMAAWTLTGGHRYRLGMALSTTSTSWGWRLESSTTGLKILWGMGYSTALTTAQAGPVRFFSEFTVPATLPDFTYRFRLGLNNGVLNLGELTMFDLTAMGLS
jgi:lysophospholipase L1-like esterase